MDLPRTARRRGRESRPAGRHQELPPRRGAARDSDPGEPPSSLFRRRGSYLRYRFQLRLHRDRDTGVRIPSNREGPIRMNLTIREAIDAPPFDRRKLTIRSIETIPLRIPLPFTYRGSYYRMRNRCRIVTGVATEEGIVGEAYNADEDEPLQSEIRTIIHDELVPAVTGLDAFQTERVWEAMLPATFDQLRPRWYAMQAMACVDTAVWDAVGQAIVQPLCGRWGGYRGPVPLNGVRGCYIPGY